MSQERALLHGTTAAIPLRPLTPQELAIARLIGKEKSYAQIGDIRGISEHTVRAHVRTIGIKIPDPPELPPRWRIFLWVRALEWEESHQVKMPKPA